MNRILVGMIVGLMISTSTIYFVEASEELVEEDGFLEGVFFLIMGLAYIPLMYWIVSKDSEVALLIIVILTVALIALYGITRTDMLESIGMEAEKIGHLGMTSKVVQFGIVIGSAILMLQSKRQSKPKLEDVKN